MARDPTTLFVAYPPRYWHFKQPKTTRSQLALMLDHWRRKPKNRRGWLCDVWQDWNNYNFNLFVYLAGVRYLLSRPRLRRWFDEPYLEEAQAEGKIKGG